MMFPSAAMAMRFRTNLVAILLLYACASLPSARAQDDEVTPEVQQLYAQAQVAQKSGDDTTAIQKYRAMIRLAPHLAAAYNNLGRLYFNQHDFANAAETLAKGLKLNPDMPTASAMLGMSYLETGQIEKGGAPPDCIAGQSPRSARTDGAGQGVDP